MKKYLRERLHAIIKLDEPPHRLALAFSVGVFIAFSPWLGLHIVSALAIAWVFRLNKVVVLTASFINNPWTIVPMYAFCLWFGVRITGGAAAVPDIAWSTLGFRDLFSVLLPFLWPFAAGTVVIGAAASVLSYGIILWLVKRYRRGEAELQAGGSP
ncbi:MAG: DUF2062 domain-containing protein [Nitrospirota bacterium]